MDIISSPYPCTKCDKRPRLSYSRWCQSCLNTYKRQHYDPTKKRHEYLYKNHRIRLEEYEMMLFRQGGVCAICHQPETVIDPYTGNPKSFCVDHHHESGQIRELLCNACNQLVGWVEKDRERVKKALAYLKKHDM